MHTEKLQRDWNPKGEYHILCSIDMIHVHIALRFPNHLAVCFLFAFVFSFVTFQLQLNLKVVCLTYLVR